MEKAKKDEVFTVGKRLSSYFILSSPINDKFAIFKYIKNILPRSSLHSLCRINDLYLTLFRFLYFNKGCSMYLNRMLMPSLCDIRPVIAGLHLLAPVMLISLLL